LANRVNQNAMVEDEYRQAFSGGIRNIPRVICLKTLEGEGEIMQKALLNMVIEDRPTGEKQLKLGSENPLQGAREIGDMTEL